MASILDLIAAATGLASDGCIGVIAWDVDTSWARLAQGLAKTATRPNTTKLRLIGYLLQG
jgi:hypothetical protein